MDQLRPGDRRRMTTESQPVGFQIETSLTGERPRPILADTTFAQRRVSAASHPTYEPSGSLL
jgi:hypothetical protein